MEDTHSYEKDQAAIWDAIVKLQLGQQSLGDSITELGDTLSASISKSASSQTRLLHESQRGLKEDLRALGYQQEIALGELKVDLLHEISAVLKTVGASVPVWVTGVISLASMAASVIITKLLLGH